MRATGIDNAVSKPVPGIDTLAAPVFDHTGVLAIVIAVMGSSGSFDSATDSGTAALVRQAAQRLSWRFGAPGRSDDQRSMTGACTGAIDACGVCVRCAALWTIV